MPLQIMSDLHLEAPKAYDYFDIRPRAPYLALLGDIGNVVSHREDYREFLTRLLTQFRVVLFVPGNHEAYHSDWPSTLSTLRAFEQGVRSDSSLGEFVLLDRAAHHLPREKTVILGCSLFSRVPPESERRVSMGLNDFYQIDDWDTKAHNDAHARDLAWLNSQVAELEGTDNKIVILTHWSPTRHVDAVEPRHAASPIMTAFSTDLSEERCFKSPSVRLWAFGHTHYNCDVQVDRGQGAPTLRLLTNQRGYYFAQSDGFDVGKTVAL
ncbi:hypothetical protein G6O67_000508 [Ophiocordyceps sinensis]|uniref:Calcineurin-like phosphoesterase domain-containing protein n=2 Tax=Ophiocordyceps sinensis TaxID=72228 RepID=A0A8H4PZB0_9HYPO|nr:calcineurin-like phosphoesterase [Ophiocordyceps sinensis CO18]KAF4513209.1 hypothetical protein G6O67_000508 [Ophiocordyceps sinensis]